VSETLATPPPGAPAKAGAAPAAAADAPTAPADVFAAILAASALAEPPPQQPLAPLPPTAAGEQGARTATAEGVEDGGDSSGPKKTDDGDAAAALPQPIELGVQQATLAPTIQAPAPPAPAAPTAPSPAPSTAPAPGRVSATPAAPVQQAAVPIAAAAAQKSSLQPDGSEGAATPPVADAAPGHEAASRASRPARTQGHTASPTRSQHPEPQAPAAAGTPVRGDSGRHNDASDPGSHGRPETERSKPSVEPTAARPTAVTSQTAVVSEPEPVATAARPAPVAETARAERPVRLHELADVVKTTVRVAAGEGRTSARVSLQPDELGRVEIHLRYESGGGVTATVTADSSAAANVLTAASGELRRTLEAQGFTVLGLDVQQGGLDLGATPDRDRPDGSGPAGAAAGRSEDELAETTTTIEASSLPLAGSQVDVLA
jgi:flagellar hook-length control protein FliK